MGESLDGAASGEHESGAPEWELHEADSATDGMFSSVGNEAGPGGLEFGEPKRAGPSASDSGLLETLDSIFDELGDSNAADAEDAMVAIESAIDRISSADEAGAADSFDDASSSDADLALFGDPGPSFADASPGDGSPCSFEESESSDEPMQSASGPAPEIVQEATDDVLESLLDEPDPDQDQAVAPPPAESLDDSAEESALPSVEGASASAIAELRELVMQVHHSLDTLRARDGERDGPVEEPDFSEVTESMSRVLAEFESVRAEIASVKKLAESGTRRENAAFVQAAALPARVPEPRESEVGDESRTTIVGRSLLATAGAVVALSWAITLFVTTGDAKTALVGVVIANLVGCGILFRSHTGRLF